MPPHAEQSDPQVLVRAEFREMPGLKLTAAQAARLFSLDRANCDRVMGGLVDDGVLALERGTYVRADIGRRDAGDAWDM